MKWYFKKRTLIVAVLVLGPLALPLLWTNPEYSAKTKILWTVLIAALTYLLGVVTHQLLLYMLEIYGLK